MSKNDSKQNFEQESEELFVKAEAKSAAQKCPVVRYIKELGLIVFLYNGAELYRYGLKYDGSGYVEYPQK